MLYSSCKASVTAVCEQHLNMEIDKKVSLLLSLCSKSKKIATFIRKTLNWIGAWIGGGIGIGMGGGGLGHGLEGAFI